MNWSDETINGAGTDATTDTPTMDETIGLEQPHSQDRRAPEQKDPFSLGSRIKQFEILGPLDKGGMGELFIAYDHKLRRKVAIKRITMRRELTPEEVATEKEFFRQEAIHASDVSNSNMQGASHIAPIYDADEAEDGSLFIVQKYIEGETLESIIEKEKTPASIFVRKMLEHTYEGIGAIHDSGLIHRDIKGKNIIITKEGWPTIVDFGIGLRVGEKSTYMAGTPGYAAPEQLNLELLGGKHLDGRADLYAMGILITKYLVGKEEVELLTATTSAKARRGQTPTLEEFNAEETVLQAALRAAERKNNRELRLRSWSDRAWTEWNYTKTLAAVASRSIHVDRNQRYSSTKEILDEIVRRTRRFTRVKSLVKWGVPGAILLSLSVAAFNKYALNDLSMIKISRNSHALARLAEDMGDNSSAQANYAAALEEVEKTWRRIEDLFVKVGEHEAQSPLRRDELIYDSIFKLVETAVNLGEYEKAEQYMLRLSSIEPPTKRVANPRMKRALEARIEKDLATALALYEEELSLRQDVRSTIRLADLQWIILNQQGGEERAKLRTKSVTLLKQAIEKVERKAASPFPTTEEELQLALLKIRLGWNLGDAALEAVGDQQRALCNATYTAYDEAYTIARSQGNHFLGGMILSSRAAFEFNLCNYQKALRLAEESVKVQELGGETGALAKSLDTLASIYSQLNRREEALGPALRANRIRKEKKNYREYVNGLYTVAEIQIGLGKNGDAAKSIAEGKERAVEEKLPQLHAKFLSLEGDLQFQQGDLVQARSSYNKAVREFGEGWKENYFAVYARIREAEAAVKGGDSTALETLLPERFEELRGSDAYNDQLITILRGEAAYREGTRPRKELLTALLGVKDDPLLLAKAQAVRAKLLAKAGEYKKAESAGRVSENELNRELNPYDTLETKLSLAEAYLTMAEETKNREKAIAYHGDAKRLIENVLKEEKSKGYGFRGLERDAETLKERAEAWSAEAKKKNR